MNSSQGCLILALVLYSAILVFGQAEKNQCKVLGCFDEYLGWCEELLENRTCIDKRLDERQLAELDFYGTLENYLFCWNTCFNLSTTKWQATFLVKIFRKSTGGPLAEIPDIFGNKHLMCGGQLNNNYQLTLEERMNVIMAEHVSIESHKKDAFKIGQFTESGLRKMKIPKTLYALLLKQLDKVKKWKPDNLLRGVFSCLTEQEMSYENEECSVKKEKVCIYNATVPAKLKEQVEKTLLPIMEEWVSENKFVNSKHRHRLRVKVGGISKFLPGVVGRAQVHPMEWPLSIRMLLNKDNLDAPAPFSVLDYHNKVHSIDLKPGEMLLYEASRIPHSLEIPLDGGATIQELDVHFALD